ncbi:protein involved in polysaccharide export, contains SLBB domain of the beta-grasp fold [Filimonas lacunae]|uniref:Protein involved in polysaccharide export, contains SLBB domain of the beta-grasp fold n=1 Tax=Filimonas lacunae TaxID=477680 RepID=A0A173MRQ7_9BACT|nr:SLBB domain-containing protein [Filimonas lacunae]BAV10196.1 polysialic acid transport protein [Filimonas lacunae]SIT18373.1 protein involved in polysaccharide export, contains SLBB domain of the beta-grasp fold [Filimonas lacunae]
MMNIKQCIRIALLCAFLSGVGYVNAQDLLKKNDLSQVKADQLSDAEIAKFSQQLQSSGLTIEQAEQIALAKGMPATEINKLKQRLQTPGTTSGSVKSTSNNGSADRSANSSEFTAKKEDGKPVDTRIFGSELFSNATLSFEPNLKIATPMNYELGVDDQIQIVVYGVQETSMDITISPEGVANIPNVGQVKLLGLTIEAATQRIKQAMSSTVYPTLRSGTSKLSVSLSRIRSIRVTIIGSSRPGNYTLSSLSTVFNALYACGGPADFGSYREIELIRNNKVDRKVDLYHFLINGDQSDNVRLKDNDVIRIPVYKKRVELKGQVKRQGIFELLPGETFDTLLQYASGFTDTAYRASVKVTQLTSREKSVKDIEAAEYASYIPQTGDLFVVAKLLSRFANRVNITGAVFRQGYFELTAGMSVADLIRKADGLKEDAYVARAQLVRLKEDLTKELLPFDVKLALNNDPAHNLKLKREDEVIVTSVFDLRDEYKITIQGEIRAPGEYMFIDSLSLKDLVILAGGLTDAAQPKRVEVARLLKRDTLTAQDERASEIFEIITGDDLSAASHNMQLKPFDVVTIRRKPGYMLLQSVNVGGQVQYPGPYVMSARSEKVSDLVQRAGGFTPEAYLAASYIKRFNSEMDKDIKREKVNKIQTNMKDTTKAVLTDIDRSFDQIPLNMEYIMAHPGSTEDLVLKPGDELVVPKFDAQVRISGSVLVPTQIPFDRSYNVRDYLSAAGGTSDYARRGKIYVLYPNGKAATTKHFLGFRNFPKVMPGAEVVVPKKREKKGLSTGETIGIASALASLAGVVIAVVNLSK